MTSDAALVEAVTRHGSADVVEDLTGLGAVAGSAEAREHGMLANRHEPELVTYDRYGNRVDEVTVPPVVALADGARRRLRPAGGPVDQSTPRTRTCAGPPGSSRGPRPSRATAARSR